MANFDMEAYLDGSLKPDERAAFEAEMARNAELAQEVRLMQQLAGDLQMQLLREQVTQSLRKTGNGKKNRFVRLFIPGLLLFCTVGYFLFFHSKTTPSATGEPNQNEIQLPLKDSEPPQNSGGQLPDGTPENKPNDRRPMAQTLSLPDPRYPAPMRRGDDSLDGAVAAVLDRIWYMEFPPQGTRFAPPFDQTFELLHAREFAKAFTQLTLSERQKPNNDTLNFLKGYCLLEMGQGEASLHTLGASGSDNPAWTAHREWYRSLALLMNGKKAEAIAAFKTIRERPGHPFQQHAGKALDLLK